MPHFFEVTPPEGDTYTLGPFTSSVEAEACRTAVMTDKPDHTVGEEFSEDQNYLNTLPRPIATMPQHDGSTIELWSDGTEKTIPAE